MEFIRAVNYFATFENENGILLDFYKSEFALNAVRRYSDLELEIYSKSHPKSHPESHPKSCGIT